MIGCGAFGHVYRAKHKIDDHMYAIKRVKLNGKLITVKLVTIKYY